jgi:RNA polymerase sigma-70 factor, ECF subfamily
MATTPVSLLVQLRRSGSQESWDRFVRLYSPLIYGWARRAGASQEAAGDLVQDVMTLLIRKMPEFEYDPAQSFRGWLRAVTLNAWRDRWRDYRTESGAGLDALAHLASPVEKGSVEDVEYRQYLVGRALGLMRTDFRPETWKACWESVVEDRPAREIAEELGITVNAVYLARSRVLRRLHQELDGLLD